MSWGRRALIGLLSLILFVTLMGTALSTSANIAFSHPDKLETWLNQSNFYDHFVDNAIDQAKKSAGSVDEQGTVTLSDTAVQQAAHSAFSAQLIQQSVKAFLDANYAWLQGKADKPNFVIDLTQAKQNYANQIGQYVQDHINSLPVCTAQQLEALGNINTVDPLNITCRPPQLSAQAEATLVTQRVQNSSSFLSNPVISPNNINPNGGSQSQPYYQKYSSLPDAYQAAVKLPWIYGIVALLSALGIVFLALTRRSGLRGVSIVLVTSGFVLVIIKFVSDTILNSAEKHIFNNANIGQLQQALTTFLHKAESQLVKIDFWFGILYLILGLVILSVLMGTRNRPAKAPVAHETAPPQPQETPEAPPATDMPPRPTPTGPPPPPKRHRLVQ